MSCLDYRATRTLMRYSWRLSGWSYDVRARVFALLCVSALASPAFAETPLERYAAALEAREPRPTILADGLQAYWHNTVLPANVTLSIKGERCKGKACWGLVERTDTGGCTRFGLMAVTLERGRIRDLAWAWRPEKRSWLTPVVGQGADTVSTAVAVTVGGLTEVNGLIASAIETGAGAGAAIGVKAGQAIYFGSAANAGMQRCLEVSPGLAAMGLAPGVSNLAIMLTRINLVGAAVGLGTALATTPSLRETFWQCTPKEVRRWAKANWRTGTCPVKPGGAILSYSGNVHGFGEVWERGEQTYVYYQF